MSVINDRIKVAQISSDGVQSQAEKEGVVSDTFCFKLKFDD